LRISKINIVYNQEIFYNIVSKIYFGGKLEEKKVLSFEKKHSKSNKSNEKHTEIEYCSFCKRPNTQVPKMVKGPGVNICSECTLIAVQYLILQDGLMSAEAQKILDLLWGTQRK